MTIFNPLSLGNVVVPNRLWRAATYEGLAGEDGSPLPALDRLYANLAAGGAGAIITGFCYVSRAGRAMQPLQCSAAADGWPRVIAAVRAAGRGTRIFQQIAHAGRQTIARATGGRVLAPGTRPSPYFRSHPRAMNEAQVVDAIDEFVTAAARAQSAGFDGVELHAAHGYLIHQFLSPYLNRRKDRWGSDHLAFLRQVVLGIRARCGAEFPVLVKISAGDFHPGGIDIALACDYAARFEEIGVAAIEVSCGTMDLPMNIFRGGLPVARILEHNPLVAKRSRLRREIWRRFLLPRVRRRMLPFREAYNRDAVRQIRGRTRLPLILVGGIRTRATMDSIMESADADAIALCRPLIREPDLPDRLRAESTTRSTCINCNACAVMCDSPTGLRCYRKECRHGNRH